MIINVTGGSISKEEEQAYVAYGQELYPDRTIDRIDITVDGDYVDLDFCLRTVPFDRIRRITGYLVGTTDRFNNAKRAEERDRVKHDVCC